MHGPATRMKVESWIRLLARRLWDQMKLTIGQWLCEVDLDGKDEVESDGTVGIGKFPVSPADKIQEQWSRIARLIFQIYIVGSIALFQKVLTFQEADDTLKEEVGQIEWERRNSQSDIAINATECFGSVLKIFLDIGIPEMSVEVDQSW